MAASAGERSRGLKVKETDRENISRSDVDVMKEGVVMQDYCAWTGPACREWKECMPRVPRVPRRVQPVVRKSECVPRGPRRIQPVEEDECVPQLPGQQTC